MCSCLQCLQLSELVYFLLWELSMSCYIFYSHRVCLVDRVDLICRLYSWWEGFGSSSLATLPLGFNCGFISTAAWGSSTGICSWGCPGGLGYAPVRARCGDGTAAQVTGFLAADIQGSWWLGQQEIQCSRRVWQPILTSTLQYSYLENPTDREAWQATVLRFAKSWTWPKRFYVHRKTFCLLQLCPSEGECEGRAIAWVMGTLAVPSVQGHGLPQLQELWAYQSVFSSLW